MLLAVATHVARREGLPEPVPITKVFPGVAEAEEGAWQDDVIRHLGLSDWQRLVIRDELDRRRTARCAATRSTTVWCGRRPSTVTCPMLDALRGGIAARWRGWRRGARRRFTSHRAGDPPRSHRLVRFAGGGSAAALGAVAPGPFARRHAQRAWRRPADSHGCDPHVPGGARAAMSRAQRRSSHCRSRRACAPVPAAGGRRRAARRNRRHPRQRAATSSSPVHCSMPTSSMPSLATAACSGEATARHVLRALVPDLLPDAVFARTTKAAFNGAYMGPHTRAFAERWTGAGVDAELVDADELRRICGSSDDRIALDCGAAPGGVARRATGRALQRRHEIDTPPRLPSQSVPWHTLALRAGGIRAGALSPVRAASARRHDNADDERMHNDEYETPAITELGSIADFTAVTRTRVDYDGQIFGTAPVWLRQCRRAERSTRRTTPAPRPGVVVVFAAASAARARSAQPAG